MPNDKLFPTYTGDAPTDMLVQLEQLIALGKLRDLAKKETNKLDPQAIDALYTQQQEKFRSSAFQSRDVAPEAQEFNVQPIDEFNLSSMPTGYIENPYFLDQTPEEQQKAKDIMASSGIEEVYKQGLQPDRIPHGKIAGAVRSFVGGVTGKEKLPTPGSSDVFNLLSGLGGEATKYAALSEVGGVAGLTGIAPEIGAGLVSGVGREALNDGEFDLENVLTEGVLAGTASSAFKLPKQIKNQNFIDDLLKVEPNVSKYTPEIKVTPSADLTPIESTTLSFFGYNPEIAQSLQKAWAGTVDKIAEKAVEKIPKNITKFFHDNFVSPAPNEAKAILDESLRMQARGKELARTIASDISGLPKQYQDDIYKFLDPTALNDPGALYGYSATQQVPEDVLRVAEVARNKIADLGAEAVGLGLLDEQTYLANIGEYLGRYYQSTPENIKDAFKRFVIRGDRFKKRILKTPEQRLQKGIITDAPYAVSRTIGELTFDIANGQAFKKIAQNPDWVKPSTFFSDVSEATAQGFKKLPKDRRYGALADTYVNDGIYQEITSIIPNNTAGLRQSGLWRETNDFYDLMLSYWKYGKTALNPATHGRNMFSNVILADLGGLPPARVDIYAKALKDYTKKSGLYDEAAGTGLFGTDWFGSEIRAYTSPVGSAKNQSMVKTVADLLGNSKVGRVLEKPGNLYQAEEHWFKMALYSQRRSLGDTPTQAAAHAQKYLFNYSDLSPFLKGLRRSPIGGPFLSFTAKSLPVIAESAVKNPVRFWKWIALFNGINEVSKANIGMNDKEYLAMQESLPEWQKSTFLTPRILLPTRDKNGNPIQIDLTYNLPWGQFGEQGQLLKHIPIVKDIPGGALLDPFIGSNPFTNLAIENITNKSLFTGKELYNPNTTTDLQALGDIAKYDLRQLAPGIAVNLPPLISAISGRKTKSGDTVDPYVEALRRIVGLKFESVDIQRGLDIKISLLENQQREIDKEENRVLYNESLTKEEQDKELERLSEIWDKYQEEIDRLDKIQSKGKKRVKKTKGEN